MKKTRWLLCLLALACMLGLVACEGETPPPTTESSGDELINDPNDDPNDAPNDAPDSGSNETTSSDAGDGDEHVHVMDLQNRCTECDYVMIAKILIVESVFNESKNVQQLIDSRHAVTVVNTHDPASMPSSVDALATFDEVILVNVANEDLPDGFDEILRTYVTELGGSLLTVGGNEPDDNPNDDQWIPHAFTRMDMYGTLYQELLPVEIINYTPPTAVVFVVDVSGSMYVPGGEIPYEGSYLYAVEQGIRASLDALTERDYVSIVTMGSMPQEILPLTSRTQRNEILSALENLSAEAGANGTVASAAIDRAGKMLAAHSDSINKHIVLITDGAFSDYDKEEVSFHIGQNTKNGITMSVIGINCTSSAVEQMYELLPNKSNFYDVTDVNSLPSIMRESLMVPELKDIRYEPFIPKIQSDDPIVQGIKPEAMPSLDGFYGSKAKSDAEVILSGKSAPIYARWTWGKGTVGSFMCDLNGTWSSEFLTSEVGITILKNIIADLLNSAI